MYVLASVVILVGLMYSSPVIVDTSQPNTTFLPYVLAEVPNDGGDEVPWGDPPPEHIPTKCFPIINLNLWEQTFDFWFKLADITKPPNTGWFDCILQNYSVAISVSCKDLKVKYPSIGKVEVYRGPFKVIDIERLPDTSVVMRSVDYHDEMCQKALQDRQP